MQISLRGLENMEKQVASAKAVAKRAKETAQEAIEAVVTLVEVNTMAFTFGVVNGRYGSPELLGIPVDLGLGMALQGLAFFDFAPMHLRNLGNGATASYFSALGVGIGRKMLSEAQVAAQRLAAAAQAPAAP